jgi:two-component system chemotaxis sensor kinase CheA
MRFTSLTDIIGSLRQQASVLAEQLGKPVPRIQAHGPHHEFRKETGQLIAHALMHLLSNSLDHGVETAAEREAAGKPRQPLISISLSSGEHGLRISYRDDGQGLILGRIRDIGVSKSLIAPQEQRPHILANLIFETGFSSSTKLTDVSGRGIGMEAARSLLAKVSANLELVLLESVESLDRPVPIEFRISFVEERFQVAA